MAHSLPSASVSLYESGSSDEDDDCIERDNVRTTAPEASKPVLLPRSVSLPPRPTEQHNGSEMVFGRTTRRMSTAEKTVVLPGQDPLGQQPQLLYESDTHSLRSMDSDTDRPERERDMSKYEHRLATFKVGPSPWPRAWPTSEELARLGFYYSGQEHKVTCHSCKATITEWDDGEDPLIKHYKKNQTCKFLLDNFRPRLSELLSLAQVRHVHPHFSNSSSRLHSFSRWPFGHLVSSFQLASVGFFYTGTGSKVQCFSCGLEYEHWRSGDIPVDIHQQYSPRCQFLKSLLKKETTTTTTSLPSPVASSHASDSTTRTPDYANERVRLKSFKHLPKTVPVSGEDCARAGLYFLRKPDVMRCFSCGALVRSWIEGDIPEEKHREVSPECKFLKEFFPNKLDSTPKTIDPSTLPAPEYNQAELKKLSSVHSSSSSHVDPLSLPEPFFTPAAHRHQSSLPAFSGAVHVGPSGSAEHEQQQSEDSKICVICMDAPLQMVLVPCGHMCVCEACSSSLLQCPMCRTPTENAVKVFLP